jgi:superfamily I DNA/RNA helicase
VIALGLSPDQRQVAGAPLGQALVVTGAAGCGKSTALRERFVRASREEPDAAPLWVASAGDMTRCALEILHRSGRAVRLVDDTHALQDIFSHVCEPLFSLRWEELAAEQLDPEVPALRSPQRFSEAAFRLICKLRDACISPADFHSNALARAAEFYAKPPNFADPKLLSATKSTDHDSLNVPLAELRRQYRREVDLVKILAKLYAQYVELVESSGRMTGGDAVAAAAKVLAGDSLLAERMRTQFRYAFADDAQRLCAAEVALLRSIFGSELAGVTLCGDPASAFEEYRGLRPEMLLRPGDSCIELRSRYRSPAIQVHRAASPTDEARFISAQVRAWLDAGVPPARIAILFRSVAHVEQYERILLEDDVPVAITGDANIWTDRRALDALALLWNVHDPFRHDWLLRTLKNPAFGLSDASLAQLCAEPPNPQVPLFAFDDEAAPAIRSKRWDPKRDLRLGWNVVGGEQDAALSADGRARIERFRALRAGWINALSSAPFETFVRRVWSEGLAREGARGSAHERVQQLVLQRLLARLCAMQQDGAATLPDVLEEAQRRRMSEFERCDDDPGDGFVRLSSIDAVRGHEFDRVVIADVRAGAFPCWYAPDAFLYSPKLGMIPKENTGDAQAPRTAKYLYYLYRTGMHDTYYARERRAFEYALHRGRETVLVTASGPPTRGVKAPEFLEELRCRPGVTTVG